MAKRKGQDEAKTQKMPPVTIETVQEKPLETIETVEIVPSEAVSDPDTEDCYIFNPDGGEMRCTRVRAGYAPAPMPFGFRLATADEIAAYIATQEG